MRKYFGWVEMVVVMVIVMMAALCQRTLATALSDNRDTWERSGEDVTMLVASGSVIYAGSMVCENGSARAVPAADTAGYAVIGCAQSKVDNSGVNYLATKTVTVRRGVFLWVNGDSFTDANVGDLAYVEDDQTVQTGASATHDVVAGVIIDVDSTGVWVDTYAVGGQGAASVTTLAASGAATLGSTLSVAGTATLSGAATVGTTLGVTGAATLASRFHTTPVANVTATNGQAMTLSGVINLMTAAGQANNYTNTVTLANPTATGQWGVIHNMTGATNLLAIAKTGNFKGPAVQLAAGESVILIAPSATTWAGIGQ